MCNDYEQRIRWAQYCEMMQAAKPGVPTQQSNWIFRLRMTSRSTIAGR
jgi:hypothetical protein